MGGGDADGQSRPPVHSFTTSMQIPSVCNKKNKIKRTAQSCQLSGSERWAPASHERSSLGHSIRSRQSSSVRAQLLKCYHTDVSVSLDVKTNHQRTEDVPNVLRVSLCPAEWDLCARGPWQRKRRHDVGSKQYQKKKKISCPVMQTGGSGGSTTQTQ